MPTPTGTKADHRLPLRAADIEVFAGALATALGAAKGPVNGANHDVYKWIGAIARDLKRNKGASLVMAGEYQPAAVHALAHVINAALDNVGKTVFYTDPIEANPVDQVASLEDLVKDLDAGAVDLLLVVGGNPVFTAPVEWGMRDRIQKARLRVHLGLRGRVGWHGDHPATADPTVIWWPLRLSVSANADGDARHQTLRHCQRLLGRPAQGRGFRSVVAQGGARWRGDRHGVAHQGAGDPWRANHGARRGPAAGRQAGGDLPARPHHLRRALRQQWMAPGAAQAHHQADLGQRRDCQPGDGAPPEGRDRRHGAVDLPGPIAARAGVHPARPYRWRGHPAPGLRPDQGRTRGHGHGIQPLRPAHRPSPDRKSTRLNSS